MRGKRYGRAVAERPAEAVALADAVAFVKRHATAKFDETMELHARLGVDPKRSDQRVRGSVTLPHGSPTPVRVAVFAGDAALRDAATRAGADVVGGTELLEEVLRKGDLDADVAVATPDMMRGLGTAAKILGPKGLMPNPKTGTIDADPAKVVASLKGGTVHFAMDDSANIHVAVAKASWEEGKIEGNVRALMDAIRRARPPSAKGEFLRSVTLSSTMGPSVRVHVS